MTVELHLGDCLDVMKGMPDGSVDSVVTDPPYPEIDRPYGRMTESAWQDMMREVVSHSRRILKPSGSAVFILQPNSEKVGRMRSWLWEFMLWTSREWNMVQDAYWWNTASMPTNHCNKGLMRSSIKPCVWLGNPDCYRNQDAVLWTETEHNIALRASARIGRTYHVGGQSVNHRSISEAAERRGGVTPYNIQPIPNTNSTDSGGSHGHGAATPLPLCSWWIRYLTPPNGTVLDMFAGSGTTGIAAVNYGIPYIGIERDADYFQIAQKRIQEAQNGYIADLFMTGKEAEL
jgi:site-specific DNA-methyltransferase (cytosine-N4-specific)